MNFEILKQFYVEYCYAMKISGSLIELGRSLYCVVLVWSVRVWYNIRTYHLRGSLNLGIVVGSYVVGTFVFIHYKTFSIEKSEKLKTDRFISL